MDMDKVTIITTETDETPATEPPAYTLGSLPDLGTRLMCAFAIVGQGDVIVEWVCVVAAGNDRYIVATADPTRDVQWLNRSRHDKYGDALSRALEIGGWGPVRVALPAEQAD